MRPAEFRSTWDPTGGGLRRPSLSLRLGVSYTTLRLACPLDFLVRVSRRVEKAPGQVGGPRAPERRSGLSRPHGRAGTEDSPRTPHERESGGSSQLGPKTGQARHVVIFPRPGSRCVRRDYTFPRTPEGARELPAFAASNRPTTVGRQPRRHGRNARQGRLHRPAPPGPF